MTASIDTTSPPAPDPSGPGGLVLRPLTMDDWPAAKALDGAAFSYHPENDFLDDLVLPTLEIGRFIGAFDPALGHLLVGIAAIQSRDLTFPGRGPSPVAAVTWVGVRPDQQRRGILRTLMTQQLHGLHRDRQEPVAILTASEAGIYGRFGYGSATQTTRLTVSTPAVVRTGTRLEPVRQLDLDEALPIMKVLHSRVRAEIPGFLDRSEAVWSLLFSEHPAGRGGKDPRRFAVHHDGYVAYRTTSSWTDRGPDGTLTISELCATTPVARASLWSHVLNYPLVRKVEYPKAWVDEPLPELLENPRAVESSLGDHVWVRLVDLPRSLALRTYSAKADVTVRVVDDFCPWNDGTWRLALTADGGRATPTAEAPEVTLGIADLGATFLGGTRLPRLALAGRVTGSARGIDALDAALAVTLAPLCPEGF
ncbi:putative acetyltransferase [Nakamurella sp. UYEF19]|uniref:GNAT family N-acetyltransferase n=1 Tax=Nakamurella sp. UYEF19 TaxID=1756392 RepID=UPI0033917DFA